METILIKLIYYYQTFFSLPLRLLTGVSGSCRFPISCSEYAREAIERDGIVKGSKKALLRLLSCQPYVHFA